jgi:hypothetical protein
MTDMVNAPPHYQGKIETIEYIESVLAENPSLNPFQGYLVGNVLKYVSRAGRKDDAAEDIGKALWYLDRLKQTFEDETEYQLVLRYVGNVNTVAPGFGTKIPVDTFPDSDYDPEDDTESSDVRYGALKS